MPWNGIRQAVVNGIAIGLPAIMVLLAVGALIGTWALSGTIVSMVYYGIKLLPGLLLCHHGFGLRCRCLQHRQFMDRPATHLVMSCRSPASPLAFD